MLSVAKKPFMLSIILLNVVMLSVVMLNVAMLSVVAPNSVLIASTFFSVNAVNHFPAFLLNSSESSIPKFEMYF